MARRFLSGLLFGGVVSVVGAILVSVFVPLPIPPEVSVAAPGAGQTPDQGDRPSASAATDSTLATGTSNLQAPAPDPDTLAALDPETTQSATQPRAGAAESLDAPTETPSGAAVNLAGDAPVQPNPQAVAPTAPQAADNLSISTEPAQPPLPVTEAPEGGFSSPDVPEGMAEDTLANALPTPLEEKPQPQSPTEQIAPAPAAPEAPETPLAPEPLEAPAIAPEPETAESLSEPQPSEPQDEPQSEDQQIAAVQPSDRPSIGTPVTSLTEREGAVAVNRLVPQAPQTEDVTSDPEEPLAEGNERPVVKFAQPFDNQENKPLMSIVLIDDGTTLTSGAAGIAALRSFPYPLSFAVDAMLPDAPERMALYRKEGFEVLALVDLPEGAVAVDAETSLGVTLGKMEQVVGVLEGVSGGLQSSREVSDQVTEILAKTGHGLVTQDKGLNTVPKLARKVGVPAAPVFRDFDSKNQSATVIRRFLDQAAFKAGQEGAVIMLGRTRPDTISALLLWGLQDRAGQVALAPVSAVLLRLEE